MKVNTVRLSLHDDFILPHTALIDYLTSRGTVQVFNSVPEACEYYNRRNRAKKYDHCLFITDYDVEPTDVPMNSGHIRDVDNMIKWLGIVHIFAHIKNVAIHAIPKRIILPLLKVPTY